MYEQKRKGKKIIVVMASRRRAMKELGRVTFSPDTTSGGGSPLVSLEREIILLNMKEREKVNNDKKYTYLRKTHINTHN